MKAGFQNEFLDVRTRDGLNDVLLSPLLYSAANGKLYRAPRGGTTDGLSVPAAVQMVIPAVGDADWWSGVIHDSAYRNQLQVWSDAADDWVLANLVQATADNLILEAMESQGVGYFKRHTIYRALRMFGAIAFKENHSLAGSQRNQLIKL